MTRRAQTTRTCLPFLAGLTAFGIAMGHLEAVVVVYIRRIMGIVPTPPVLDPDVLAKLPSWLVRTEISREAATIVMLLALAYLAGRGWWERLATFLYAFAVWDIFYYVSLKIMINWPATLQTGDLLFLIPHPWFGPVWLPVSISAGMIVIALFIFALLGRRWS